MNRILASLTFGILLGRKRTVFIGLVLLLPVGIAGLYRASDEVEEGGLPVDFAFDLGNNLILTVLLPIVALVLGTSALGSEIEDGTAVFLLTKPVERWRVMLIKTLVSAAATVLLVAPATTLTAWIIMGSLSDGGVALGLGLSAVVMSVLYAAVFVALSAVTHRALIVGLIYVFVWEAFATNLFSSLRWLSIREYSEGWSRLTVDLTTLVADAWGLPAEALNDPALDDIISDFYNPSMSSGSAIVGSLAVLAVSYVVGVRALRNYEIGEVS